MVEGYAVSSAAYDLPYPSTTLRVIPLPPAGEDHQCPLTTAKWTSTPQKKTLSYMARLCQLSSQLFIYVDKGRRCPTYRCGQEPGAHVRRARQTGRRTRLTFPDL
ncbi:hypothetical protein SPYCA_0603 [Sphingopyxis sp. FD7]|nr:hypothetical protein SPYCA_0603 [Sphingopyxis sp. FD7]